MDEDAKETKPKRFIQSEVLKNYAGAIAILLGALPAVGSLIVSTVTAYRGEPVAEKTWATVRNQLNHQAAVINRLNLRVIYLQAHEEGKTSAALQLKLDDLQKKYDRLTAATSDNPPLATSLPAARSIDCRDGHIKIDDKCRPVARNVADKVKADEKEVDEIRLKLETEKRRRMEEEKRRRSAEQKVQSAKSAPLLKTLPKKLDDV